MIGLKAKMFGNIEMSNVIEESMSALLCEEIKVRVQILRRRVVMIAFCHRLPDTIVL